MAEENYRAPDADQEEDSGQAAQSAQDEAQEILDEAQHKEQSGKELDEPTDEDGEEAGTESNAEECTQAGNGAASGTSEKKSGFFSRTKKADKEKLELQEKIDGLEDKVRRQMAEFDNYRRRTEKEKDQMFSMGERSVIEKMLPIVDNFERGFDTVDEEDQDDAFVSGMQKIYQQLIRQLDALGVKPIEALGQEFNPEFHNAVMQVESDEYESGIVAQELQKGYLYHDQVIRHSMVAVVQ